MRKTLNSRMAGSLIGCLLSFFVFAATAGAGHARAFSDAGMDPVGECFQDLTGIPAFSDCRTAWVASAVPGAFPGRVHFGSRNCTGRTRP